MWPLVWSVHCCLHVLCPSAIPSVASLSSATYHLCNWNSFVGKTVAWTVLKTQVCSLLFHDMLYDIYESWINPLLRLYCYFETHVTGEFHIGYIRCKYLFCSLIYYISLGRQFGICLNDWCLFVFNNHVDMFWWRLFPLSHRWMSVSRRWMPSWSSTSSRAPRENNYLSR